MKQLKKLACRAVLDLRMTFPPKTVLSIILGTAITTFGIYNVHRQADITEGGILRSYLVCKKVGQQMLTGFSFV